MPEVLKQGSQEPKQGSQEEVPKQGSAGSQARYPSKAYEQASKKQGSKEKVPKQRFQEQVKFLRKVPNNRLPARFPRTGPHFKERFQEQVPKQGSQEQVADAPRNSCPRTTSQARPRRTAASKVASKNRIPSKVSNQGSKARLSSTALQARSRIIEQ